MSEPLHCPVCRIRVEQGPQCRRCRADLTLLLALADQRQQALIGAYRQAAQGQWDQALATAHGIEAIHGGRDVCRLLALGCLLRRDFARAWRWYTAGAQPRPSCYD